jgi:hypothetical protein
MTRKEFNSAIARRGWRKVLMWIEIDGRRSIGMVMRKGRRGYKVNLRASRAPAIAGAALMLIFMPSYEDYGFDHEYPRGVTPALLVAVALSLATVVGFAVALWRLV